MALTGNDVSDSAPPKGVCGACAVRFYGKQQFLICSAGCNRRFHCKCINVGQEEYNVYMASGKSTFKCTGCTRRRSLSPTNAGTSSPSGDVNTTDATLDEDALTALAGNFPPPGLVRVIESLSSKLDVLKAEIMCLRADNNSLRSVVQQLRKNVMERMPLPSSSPPLYASVTAHSSVVSSVASSSRSTRDAPIPSSGPPSTREAFDASPRRPAGTTNPEILSGNGAHAATEITDDDGFTMVRPRRRTKPSTGTAKTKKVTAVPRSKRPSALFVSRLAPDTSVADVMALIAPFLEGKPVICSKMIAKFDSYSSFHLSGDESVFNAINNPEVWPEGSIFHQFFGRLDSSRVHPVSEVDSGNGPEG